MTRTKTNETVAENVFGYLQKWQTLKEHGYYKATSPKDKKTIVRMVCVLLTSLVDQNKYTEDPNGSNLPNSRRYWVATEQKQSNIDRFKEDTIVEGTMDVSKKQANQLLSTMNLGEANFDVHVAPAGTAEAKAKATAKPKAKGKIPKNKIDSPLTAKTIHASHGPRL